VKASKPEARAVDRLMQLLALDDVGVEILQLLLDTGPLQGRDRRMVPWSSPLGSLASTRHIALRLNSLAWLSIRTVMHRRADRDWRLRT